MSDAFLQVGLEGIIERLSGELAAAQAEIERLKAALREIANYATGGMSMAHKMNIARDALEGKK